MFGQILSLYLIVERKRKSSYAEGHQADHTLIGIIFGILIFGLIMLASASAVVAFDKFGDSNYYIKHQLLYGVFLGLIAFWFTSRIHYHYWKRLAFPLMVITVVLLLLVLIPGLGYEFLGAKRWINFGGILFQPTELTKLTFLIYLATWLERRGKGIEDVTYGMLPFLFVLGAITLLIMLQPDMGTMTVIAAIAMVVYFVAGAPWKHLSWIGGATLALFALLIKIAPYRTARLTVFLNPELDPQGIGYHINQALLAIGSGGFFGLGLGHSRQKYNYLPEVTGDSIFAIIAEEMGFIFGVLLIALFIFFMIRGYRIAKGTQDAFGKLLAVGITTWIVFQALVNIGAMVSVVPLTGIPMPLVSYGSSSLITTLASLGILVNISKHSNFIERNV